MATTQQVTDLTWKDHLASLDFISISFSWLFMLMTRLAEPLLMLATIYIVSETAVPALHSAGWESAALTVMVTAPEIVLPGSFVVARHAKQNNEPHATLLAVMCWAFVFLMLATIADVLIFHFVGILLALLMFVRCSVAVGYSILMRVMQHGKKQEQSVPTVIAPLPVHIPANFTAVSIATRRVNRVHIGSVSGFISMCSATCKETERVPEKEAIPVQEPTRFDAQIEPEKETENDVEERTQSGELYALDTDLINLLSVYQNLPLLLSTGRRTATIKELSECTGISERWIRNRIAKRLIKVSSRNKDLVLIESFIEWLKTRQNTPENLPDTTEHPALKLVQKNA